MSHVLSESKYCWQGTQGFFKGGGQKKRLLLTKLRDSWKMFSLPSEPLGNNLLLASLSTGFNGFLNLQSQHVKMWTYYVLWQRWQKWPACSPVGWERVGLLYCAQAEQMVSSDAVLVHFIKELFCRPLFILKCSDKFFSWGNDPFSLPWEPQQRVQHWLQINITWRDAITVRDKGSMHRLIFSLH